MAKADKKNALKTAPSTSKDVKEENFRLPSSSDESSSEEEQEGEGDFGEDDAESFHGLTDSEDEETDQQTKGTEKSSKKGTEKQKQQDVIKMDSGHTIKKASKQEKQKQQKEKRGIIYIGRLPDGFEEHELTKYFSQFGDITRLRLSRNRKTGKSKHYAFVEFKDHQVAEVAAETMNNYLLYGHLLRTHVISPSQAHETLFEGSLSSYKVVPWRKLAQRENDLPKAPEKLRRLSKNHSKRKLLKQSKLKDAGIDFDLSQL